MMTQKDIKKLAKTLLKLIKESDRPEKDSLVYNPPQEVPSGSVWDEKKLKYVKIIKIREVCQECRKVRKCETVHIDKGVTERWCKKCRDEEENCNEGINNFPEVHI